METSSTIKSNLRSRAAAHEGSLQIPRITAIEGLENKENKQNNNKKKSKAPTDTQKTTAALKKAMADAKSVLAKINAPYAFVNNVFTKMGAAIASVLSMRRAGEGDAKVITGELYALTSVAVAIWVAYNWFFIFVYKARVSVGPEIMRVVPLDMGHFAITAALRYTVVPLYVTQMIAHDYIAPVFDKISRMIGDKFAFIIIFAIAVFMVRDHGDFIVREFFEAIQCKFSAMMAMWSIMMIGYSLYITFHVEINIPVLGPYINPFVDFANTYYMMLSPFSMIVAAIRFFIRLGFAMAIGFVSSALVFGYILFISLFSVVAYKDSQLSVGETLKTMISVVAGDVPEDRCGMTMMEKIVYFGSLKYYFESATDGERDKIRYKVAKGFFIASEYVYEALFQIAFILAFWKSTRVFSLKIKTRGLSLVLFVIMTLISSTLCLSTAIRLYTKYSTDPPDIEKKPKVQTVSPPSGPDSPKVAPDSPKMAPDSPKMAPNSPKMAPDSVLPKVAPDSVLPKVAPDSVLPKVAPDSVLPKVAPDSVLPTLALTSPEILKKITVPKMGSVANHMTNTGTKLISSMFGSKK